MKRFEFAINAPDEFEIDNESIDNIKSYLCYCFKVDHVDMGSWGLPDWFAEWQEQRDIDPRDCIDLEIPF